VSSRKRAVAAVTLLVAAAGVVAFYRMRRPTTTVTDGGGGVVTPQLTPPPPKPSGPTPLPDTFESPGLVSRRDGPLRLYVAAASEVPIKKDSAQAGPGAALSYVPILVVLENDTYDRVDTAGDLSLTGDKLFTVGVSRAGSNGEREEVFSYSEPSTDVGGWGPAERKSFRVSWPAANAAPGDYLISVTPAYGKREKVELHTTLK
jgi:hypothetical protein